ncbi:hypothetical protein [Deinococcus hopiensis]|uniref:Uncharacterized protein n=1 Tax=Deinococcus hopiensis KR-140 TaxID=695939 RepID=A0A1W1VHQ2_9DEIO|nr:hypothetical protein [Deinococcus hopiensis]SMB92760.1 hypothetical protein SAMN00790413_01720 [Deinococcus hopiensis KR-140]
MVLGARTALAPNLTLDAPHFGRLVAGKVAVRGRGLGRVQESGAALTYRAANADAALGRGGLRGRVARNGQGGGTSLLGDVLFRVRVCRCCWVPRSAVHGPPEARTADGSSA